MSLKARADHKAQLQRRHDSAAHLLAEAIQERFPGAQVAGLYANVEGFLCEFTLAYMLESADLAALEQRIALMVARDLPCTQAYWSRSRALAHFRSQGQGYRVAQLEQTPAYDAFPPAYMASYPHLCACFPANTWPADVLVYQHGNFVDLCAGPHVEHVGEIGLCKLERVEDVRAQSDATQQRIYGIVEP